MKLFGTIRTVTLIRQEREWNQMQFVGKGGDHRQRRQSFKRYYK